jgi:hypothetical protein
MPDVNHRNLMLATWHGLGDPRVGAKELRKIQRELEKQLGASGVTSPAAVARVLADAGADLIHPEIIEADARWRDAQLQKQVAAFRGLAPLISAKQMRLADAEALITQLEELRQQFVGEKNRDGLSYLTNTAAQAREQAESQATSAGDQMIRDEQSEIAQWLKVWLQTPKIFAGWVELRKRSPEFKEKFANYQSEST